MAAALTIAALFAISFTVVRIAAVVMRLTGLPQNVARFQCISALTGTGFTTRESEMIVNYPMRRNVLVVLMTLGHLGLVSITATFIVAFVDVGPKTNAIFVQAAAIAIAIVIVVLVMTNKTLDKLMCDFAGRILLRTTSLGQRRYQPILQLENRFSVAEHTITGARDATVGDLSLDALPLTLLAIRGSTVRQRSEVDGEQPIVSDEILICYGSDAAHEKLEDLLAKLDKDYVKPS